MMQVDDTDDGDDAHSTRIAKVGLEHCTFIISPSHQGACDAIEGHPRTQRKQSYCVFACPGPGPCPCP